jgi:hypothetical protein
VLEVPTATPTPMELNVSNGCAIGDGLPQTGWGDACKGVLLKPVGEREEAQSRKLKEKFSLHAARMSVAGTLQSCKVEWGSDYNRVK